MYIDIKSATKDELMNYINEMHPVIKDFQMTPDYIGKTIVMQMQTCEKSLFPMIGIVTSESSQNPIMWGAFRLEWYDRKLFKDNEYKTRLIPIGKYWSCMPERAWYNCSFESNVYCGDALIVDDPIEAVEIADKLNEFKIGLEE